MFTRNFLPWLHVELPRETLKFLMMLKSSSRPTPESKLIRLTFLSDTGVFFKSHSVEKHCLGLPFHKGRPGNQLESLLTQVTAAGFFCGLGMKVWPQTLECLGTGRYAAQLWLLKCLLTNETLQAL